MRVNSLLASKNFSVAQKNIVVGNGAAELIKSLMQKLTGKTGFVRPTFEEYPNRYDKENSVVYTPNNKDFSCTAEDLINYFADKPIETLVVINPDNPSGNYIPYKGLQKLIAWTKERGVKLIVDESFADFSDENETLIKQSVLDENPHLYVMKSISKSYGVPGLRLGVLASGDTDAIDFIKKDVSIWNINSFAEFYMQIEEKYKKDYARALTLFRKERSRFVEELSKIEALRILPSQANYLMMEISGMTAKELTKRLLVKHNLFIKDLSKKVAGEYIRVAIRGKADNDKLISALKEELGE
jgi:histidinol-phosphate/aromatic aminotransferase/cobyric acid decarboxylase-like protein